MSEPTASAARPAAKPKGKTYGGLTRNQWLIFGGVFAVAVGYLLWRRYEAAKAATSASTTTSTSTATAATLAALEDELAQLQNQGYGAGAAGGGTAGSSGPVAYSTQTSTPAGTPTSTSGTTSSGTGAAATTTKTPAKTAGAISNLQASSVGTTTATIKWNAASNATQGYAYRVTEMNGTLVKSGNTSATSVSLSGLHKGWTYNFGIQGLPGGPGNNIHFTTKS